MKKLYQNNELTFALCWIGIYVISLSIADGLSSDIGIEKMITAPLCLLMSGFILHWINQMNLKEKYGLVQPKIPMKSMLYYLPLVFIASTNLWGGMQMNYTIFESVLYVVSMLCVGFLEEIIFRGFLFKSLCKDNLNHAILISSMTFGIGHIVNLLNGAELISTLVQIAYAISAGYLFTILLQHTGSLIPCILTHSALNSLSAFAAERSALLDNAAAVFLTIVPLLYAAWIMKITSKRPQ